MSQPPSAAVPPPAPTRRRRWGCLAKTGCGLLAFLVGAGLMLVFLVPPLLGRYVASAAETEFERTREGRLALDEVGLHWFRRQGIGGATLSSPEGQPIARARVELPSIVDGLRTLVRLEEGERARLEPIVVHLDLDLVVDDDGRSNLERALAPRGGVAPKEGVEVGGTGSESLARYLELLDAELVVRSERISVSTPKTRAGGVELALLGLEARLTQTAAQPLRLVASARSSGGGSVEIDGRLAGARLDAAGPGFDGGNLTAKIVSLPTAIVAAFVPQGEDLVAVLGPQVDARVELALGAGEARSAVVEFASAGAKARFSMIERAGLLELDPSVPNTAELVLPREWIEARSQSSLPEGLGLASGGETLTLTLALERLSLPLSADASPTPRDLSRATLVARGTLGPIELAFTPAPSADGDASEPIVQRLRGATFDLNLEPQTGLVAKLSSDLEPQGSLEADLRLGAPALAALLAGEMARGIELDAKAQNIPTALLDAFARQDGLLVDVLGPTLGGSLAARELALGAAASAGGEASALDGARLEARLESDLGRVDFQGQLVGMRLVATGEEGLTASARLSPLLSSRIVGPLLPLLVALEQPPGAGPVRIVVRDLSVPLEARPGEIDARVRLELGDIRAQLLPSLASHLPAAAELQPKLHSLIPIDVRIRAGVASYEKLPIVLDGKRIDLAGTFNLVSGQLDLRTELPLRHLGGEVREALRSVSGFVSPDLAVPVALVGTLSRPRLRLSDGFVEGLLRDAARKGVEERLEGGIREGVQGILERLKKKDG